MQPEALLHSWHFRLDRMQGAYYEAARRDSNRHKWLGAIAAAMSALVGTSVFLSLAKVTDRVEIQAVTGLLSLAAAVLAALQAFLKQSEAAEKHRVAGARFANLKHRVELLLAFRPSGDESLKIELSSVEESWNKIRQESPNLPSGLWRKFEAEFEPEKFGNTDVQERK